MGLMELTDFLVGVLLKLESVLQSKPLLWHLEHGAGNVSAASHLDYTNTNSLALAERNTRRNRTPLLVYSLCRLSPCL